MPARRATAAAGDGSPRPASPHRRAASPLGAALKRLRISKHPFQRPSPCSPAAPGPCCRCTASQGPRSEGLRRGAWMPPRFLRVPAEASARLGITRGKANRAVPPASPQASPCEGTPTPPTPPPGTIPPSEELNRSILSQGRVEPRPPIVAHVKASVASHGPGFFRLLRRRLRRGVSGLYQCHAALRARCLPLQSKGSSIPAREVELKSRCSRSSRADTKPLSCSPRGDELAVPHRSASPASHKQRREGFCRQERLRLPAAASPLGISLSATLPQPSVSCICR